MSFNFLRMNFFHDICCLLEHFMAAKLSGYCGRENSVMFCIYFYYKINNFVFIPRCPHTYRTIISNDESFCLIEIPRQYNGLTRFWHVTHPCCCVGFLGNVRSPPEWCTWAPQAPPPQSPVWKWHKLRYYFIVYTTCDGADTITADTTNSILS